MKFTEKISKKSIDIESEFIGSSVGPRKPKVKKNDLTQDLKEFLENKITLQSIEKIILRIEGRWVSENPIGLNTKIYSIIPNNKCDEYEFFIKIKCHKYFNFMYYLTSSDFIKLERWSGNEKINKSDLRCLSSSKIYNWLVVNLHQTKVIE